MPPSQPAASQVLSVGPGALLTSRLDRLQKTLHCWPRCQRPDTLMRPRPLQLNPGPEMLLQEGASCGPSCGPTSDSKPGLQAHFMCEQLAHRVRQLSLEKQVRLCCLAPGSYANEVFMVPIHNRLPEVHVGALLPDLWGLCVCAIDKCTVHLFKHAQ